MTAIGTREEVVVPGMPYEPAEGSVALCIVDQNVGKVIAVLMNPCDPRLDEDLFRDSLAKTLNILVISGFLPDNLGYPYNIISGPTFLERVSVSMRLGRLDLDFPGLPAGTKEKIQGLTGAMAQDTQAGTKTPGETIPTGLQRSPNWQYPDVIQNSLNLATDLPHEEFPKGGHHGDGKRFEIITDDGEKHIALVDFSTEYRSEGKQWRIISSDTLIKRDYVDKYRVRAWREV